ncbi:MAG: 30S ribosomal protein S3ae [Promethearchaeota archaeon]|nr:MAG: 30S ribosomal protein S3ae [Candidatus Lokiarchaeota archaeon]
MSSRAKKRKPKLKKVTFRDKNWYKILAPRIFKNKEIGEVIGTENNIIGRIVETLMYDFTGEYKDISLKLNFKIVEVNEEAKKCNTLFQGHSYTNDYIRSLVNRGSTKIQTILNLTTKDKYTFRVTMIATTIRRARSSQQILIRKIVTEILREFAKSLNHEKFIAGMVYGEFQNQILRVAKTIYPLSNSVIIKSKLVTIPEGGVDKEIPDDQFEIVEVEVKRSRKSEIKRSERINVKKLSQSKSKTTEESKEEESKEPITE